MAEEMALRSAINGFNRRDVINCVQQINNKHKLQVQMLEAQLGELQAENDRLKAQLEAALAKPTVPCGSDAQELETYRRAERTEREARERAARVPTLQKLRAGIGGKASECGNILVINKVGWKCCRVQISVIR